MFQWLTKTTPLDTTPVGPVPTAEERKAWRTELRRVIFRRPGLANAGYGLLISVLCHALVVTWFISNVLDKCHNTANTTTH